MEENPLLTTEELQLKNALVEAATLAYKADNNAIGDKALKLALSVGKN